MNAETSLYKLLAMAFWRPDETVVAALRETPQFRETLSDISLDALEKEHRLIFSLSVAGGVSPYETEYGLKDVFMKTQHMADISGFYRAFGFAVSPEAHERIDFIGAELELMHWLILKERHAEETDRPIESRLCHDASAKFLEDHLGRWAPFFGEQITKNTQLPFYQELGRQLTAFIRSECDRLGVKPQEITRWEPSPPVPELSCDASECGVELQDVATPHPSAPNGLPVVK